MENADGLNFELILIDPTRGDGEYSFAELTCFLPLRIYSSSSKSRVLLLDTGFTQRDLGDARSLRVSEAFGENFCCLR